jgi:choline dehydrogenase-like flavoprotein
VLCAGAIRTPALLLQSGVDTPGVGSGLQDHVGVAISFDLRAPNDIGPTIGATVEREGRQIVVMDRLPGRPEMGAVLAGHLAIVSVGRVTVPDPDRPPLVELNQLGSPADLDGLQLVVTEALALLRSQGMQDVVGERYVDRQGTPASTLESDADALRAWLPDHLGGYHHVAGSCRIGTALDRSGSLLGYDGLFVADASALPHGPPRNLYLTVIRQAEALVRGWMMT